MRERQVFIRPGAPPLIQGLRICEIKSQAKRLSRYRYRAWVSDRLMRHAQVCLGEIPLRLKMRKAHSADVMELETHQRDASAANRALELLGREVNLFTEKKEVGKPGEFDHTTDEELAEFIVAQGEVVRELERQQLPPPAPTQRKGATKH